ncbi:hypothetical protein GCM10022236_34480 [Microlunatus ginsengisoli]|uniref:DUF222 domain-containing protein n=1 Tax=Microlunatus ginsengisoli TaxID=363863 RepID=A0ABP7ACZ9_9ACTN
MLAATTREAVSALHVGEVAVLERALHTLDHIGEHAVDQPALAVSGSLGQARRQSLWSGSSALDCACGERDDALAIRMIAQIQNDVFDIEAGWCAARRTTNARSRLHELPAAPGGTPRAMRDKDRDDLRRVVLQAVQMSGRLGAEHGMLPAQQHPAPGQRGPRLRPGLAVVEARAESAPPAISDDASQRLVAEPVRRGLDPRDDPCLSSRQGKQRPARIDSFVHTGNLRIRPETCRLEPKSVDDVEQ